MRVLFIIEIGAYNVVCNCLKKDIGNIDLGLAITINMLNCICLQGIVRNDCFKQQILNKQVDIKGLRSIYVEY